MIGEQPFLEEENNQKLPVERSDMKDVELSEKPLPSLEDEQAVRATELGIKPMALVYGAYDTSLPYIIVDRPKPKPIMKNGIEVVRSIERSINYIYYQPDKESAARDLEKILLDQTDLLFGKLQLGDIWKQPSANKEYHQRMGELLGYTKKEIDEFLDRQITKK